jgi:hypothetical protein
MRYAVLIEPVNEAGFEGYYYAHVPSLDLTTGRNASDVTTFHHSNGIHDQGSPVRGIPLSALSGGSPRREMPA